MKLLIIVDRKNNWSIHNRAKQLKKHLPDLMVDIKATEDGDITVENFELNYKYYDIIHFACTPIVFKKFFEKYPNTMITSLNSHGCISGVFGKYEDLEFCYKNSAKVVALNNKLAHCFENCIYIPNGVDTKLFAPYENRKKIKVGFVGIRTEAKGYKLAHKACKELSEYVDFIDDGNDHPTKFKTQEEMVQFYRDIDVLILPSDNEGSSNAMLEALATGKQVICTDIGNADVLPGCVVVKKTLEDIKRGICHFIPDVVIKEEWNWYQVAKQYRQVWVNVYKQSIDLKKYYYDRAKSNQA